MNKFIELPLAEPLYSTYHNQGPATAITVNNPSINNWYLNNIMNLTCNRKFLKGFTTPEITVENSSWVDNPYLEKHSLSTRFIKGYMNFPIKQMLNEGYYVFFTEIDDFYIPGKSWYGKRHFSHDGLICGFNQDNKTYCIYAYDSNWVYKKFWVPQKSLNIGRETMAKKGVFSDIYAIKAKKDTVIFSVDKACENINKYLDSNLKKQPFSDQGNVFGIVVHEYIAEYIQRLYEQFIPYERMDQRVFRIIWEHKKVMLKRIEALEQTTQISSEFSQKYKSIVTQADTLRLLYASHKIKRRDLMLPIIKEKLLSLMHAES